MEAVKGEKQYHASYYLDLNVHRSEALVGTCFAVGTVKFTDLSYR